MYAGKMSGYERRDFAHFYGCESDICIMGDKLLLASELSVMCESTKPANSTILTHRTTLITPLLLTPVLQILYIQ